MMVESHTLVIWRGISTVGEHIISVEGKFRIKGEGTKTTIEHFLCIISKF